MNCKQCDRLTKKNGKDRSGNQRFRWVICNLTFTESKQKPLGNMYLNEDKAVMCLSLLVEGSSIRSIERITGVHRDTIISLLETVGEKCLWIQENLVKNLKVGDIQADEIWSFISMKDKTKNRQNIEDGRIGSAYTCTAIESESKLIVAWHLGRRTEYDTLVFLEKVANAIEPTKRFQMTTDGFPAYEDCVTEVLGTKADYAQIIKIYGKPNPNEVRYSAAECIGCKKKVISGNPLKERISTSYVERANLTMRMSMRRFTRLTNAFSKKWENHQYAIALHFAHYNFCRGHKTLNGATPGYGGRINQDYLEPKRYNECSNTKLGHYLLICGFFILAGISNSILNFCAKQIYKHYRAFFIISRISHSSRSSGKIGGPLSCHATTNRGSCRSLLWRT
jgi:transposase-like protein/IS1 family transposase